MREPRISCHSSRRVERQPGEERKQHVDTAAVRLADHAPALGGDAVVDRKPVEPAGIGGEEAFGERHSELDGELARALPPQALAIGVVGRVAEREIDTFVDPRTEVGHRLRERGTSCQSASRDATGRSSDVSWCWLCDVVNPIAPARSAASSWLVINSRSSAVAASVNS